MNMMIERILRLLAEERESSASSDVAVALEDLSTIRDGSVSLDDFSDESVNGWIKALGGPAIIPLLLSDADSESGGALRGIFADHSRSPDPGQFKSAPGDYIVNLVASRMPASRTFLEQIRREAGIDFLSTAAGDADVIEAPDKPERINCSLFLPGRGYASWKIGIACSDSAPVKLEGLSDHSQALIEERHVFENNGYFFIDRKFLPSQFEVFWVFPVNTTQPNIEEHGELVVVKKATDKTIEVVNVQDPAWWQLAWLGLHYDAWLAIADQVYPQKEARQCLHFVFGKMSSLLDQACDDIDSRGDEFNVSPKKILRAIRTRTKKQQVSEILGSLVKAYAPS